MKLGLIDNVKKTLKVQNTKNYQNSMQKKYSFSNYRNIFVYQPPTKNISEKKNGTYSSSLKQMNGSQYIIRGNKKKKLLIDAPK